jgi:acyl carrier protein
MTHGEVLAKLNKVFREVFDDDDINLSPGLTARDIDGWDSQANIRLMVSIEDEFGIRFTVGEFQDYRNVGDLIAGIERLVG